MTRARITVVSVLLFSLAGCSFGPPTPEQMKQMVVGQWVANSSAVANAARAMKISTQNPGVSSSQATAAGRAMGNVALEFHEDGKVLAALQTSVWEGTWTFDAEKTMVEMDLTQTTPRLPKSRPSQPRLPGSRSSTRKIRRCSSSCLIAKVICSFKPWTRKPKRTP